MNGTLGKVVTTASGNVVAYEVPATANFATASIFLCNTNVPGAADAVVNIAITTAASPAAADYIEFGAVLPSGAVLERTCMPMSPGDKVMVFSTAAGVAVRVAGLEEAAA